MGRAPCCDKANVKKGPWSPEEDAKLKEYIEKSGTGGNWIALPQKAGLKRCGKSCRLRWLNYLRPNIKHGEFTDDEDRIICSFFASIGSRWSIIAAQLPGRTDNDIKNYWNTKLKKKIMGMNPSPHQATLLSLLQNSTSSSSSSSASASSPLSFRDSHPHGSSSSSASDQSMSYSFFQPQESLREAGIGYSGTFVEHMVGEQLLQNNTSYYNYNYLEESGMGREENEKVMMGYINNDISGWTEKQIGGLWEENPPLDYGIQEIKQLLSTTGSNCNNFLFDENKTERRAVYYY